MDLQRRMLHIWAVGSVAWLAHWLWETWNTCASDGDACTGLENWIDLSISALGIPVAALLIGAAVAWSLSDARRAQ